MKHVYTHSINGVVFYVGCGSGSRPYSDKSRSRVWHKIVNDNNRSFDIDIVFRSHNKHEALLEESKLIMSLQPKANLGRKGKLYKHPTNKKGQSIKTEDVNQFKGDFRMKPDWETIALFMVSLALWLAIVYIFFMELTK